MVVISHLSALGLGRPAVMLFFMLSGYWVPRMFEQQYRPTTTVRVFYLSRLLRVWLPFAVAFVGVFLLHALTATPESGQVLWGLSLLGLASTHKDVLGTAWSLDIEVQFYLAVPLLWLCLDWCQRRGVMLWAMAGAVPLFLLGWYLQKTFDLWSVLSYLPPFLAGMLIWMTRAKASARAARISLLAFVLAGALVLAVPGLRPLLIYRDAAPFDIDWFGMAWVLLLTPFVIWNLQQKSSARDMHFGNFSYALYITHWPVIALMQPLLAPVSMADKLAMLGVIAGVSVTFYVLVDRPCDRFRRKVIARLSRSGQGAAVRAGP